MAAAGGGGGGAAGPVQRGRDGHVYPANNQTWDDDLSFSYFQENGHVNFHPELNQFLYSEFGFLNQREYDFLQLHESPTKDILNLFLFNFKALSTFMEILKKAIGSPRLRFVVVYENNEVETAYSLELKDVLSELGDVFIKPAYKFETFRLLTCGKFANNGTSFIAFPVLRIKEIEDRDRATFNLLRGFQKQILDILKDYSKALDAVFSRRYRESAGVVTVRDVPRGLEFPSGPFSLATRRKGREAAETPEEEEAVEKRKKDIIQAALFVSGEIPYEMTPEQARRLLNDLRYNGPPGRFRLGMYPMPGPRYTR